MHTQQLEEILDKCKAQDRAAQYELYNMYSKAMYNVCVRMMKDDSSAEDALQMAFVKAFKNIDSYKYDATFGAWLKRIVINTCISELNKRKVFFQEVDDKDYVEVENEETDHAYDIQRIQYAMQMLPEGYRVIFTMYAVEGYDHQEISQVMGISEGTSKSQYSRAKVKLKELLLENERIANIS